MTDMIVTSRPELLTEGELAVELLESYGRHEISDQAALTIASYWQSPGSVGRAMSELASTGRVSSAELMEDITHSLPDAQDLFDRRSLNMLATWAMNHESRGE